jgi:hypothetical protein
MPRVRLPLLLLLAAACRTPAPAAAAPGAEQAPAQQQAPPKPQPTAEQACAVTLCREPRTVTLVLDEEREMRQELPPFPYVYRDVVYVVPGDDFRLTGEVQGDRLVKLRVVKEGESPPQALRIRFSQEVESGTSMLMVLAVDSTLSRALRYTVSMLPAESAGGFQPTSSCPVPPGRSVYESWPQPLRTLVLEDLRLVDLAPGSAAKCE